MPVIDLGNQIVVKPTGGIPFQGPISEMPSVPGATQIVGGGYGITPTVFIENAQVLREIAAGAGLTEQYLARDAANAALDLYTSAEAVLPDEIKGKIHIEVAPYSGQGRYIVQATVNTEPSVRRTASNATVRVDKSGRVLRNSRYINAREVPSMTAYIAMQMHRTFDEVVPKVQDRANMAVQEHIRQSFEQLGVKVDINGLAHAPSGGIEFGGTFYQGGAFLPV